jgi:hypothetical protein
MFHVNPKVDLIPKKLIPTISFHVSIGSRSEQQFNLFIIFLLHPFHVVVSIASSVLKRPS